MATVPEEPLPPEPSTGTITRRAFAWGTLGLVLAGGTAARLASPGTQLAARSAIPAELVSLTPDEAAVALQATAFDPAVRAAMLVAVHERRLHLVRAPFFGVGSAVGAHLTAVCGAVVSSLVLTTTPVALLLPIERAGRIVVTTRSVLTGEAGVGLVTASTPVVAPPPPPGQSLIFDVIVL